MEWGRRVLKLGMVLRHPSMLDCDVIVNNDLKQHELGFSFRALYWNRDGGFFQGSSRAEPLGGRVLIRYEDLNKWDLVR
jgi:hypothetical protein